MLEHTDGSEMCISEMAVILTSVGVTPLISKVAEMFQKISFDTGIERGLVQYHVTGWDTVDEEQMDEEKPASLIGSPLCRTFCDLIMVMRNANGVGEVKYESLVKRCVKYREERKGCTRCRGLQTSCSCMRILGTDGLVDSVSYKNCAFQRNLVAS